MRAMLSIDFVTMRSFLSTTIATSLFVLIALVFGMRSLTASLAAICAMVPLVCLMSLGTYDEYNNWGQFRLAMPLSRTHTVLGRYASMLVVAAETLVAAIVLGVAIHSAASLIPGELATELRSASLTTVAGSSMAALSCAIVGCAITLPLAMRFGMTKAIRFVPLLATAFFALLLTIASSSADLAGSMSAGAQLVQWLDASETNMLVGAGCILAASLALYAASAALAIRLYATREL